MRPLAIVCAAAGLAAVIVVVVLATRRGAPQQSRPAVADAAPMDAGTADAAPVVVDAATRADAVQAAPAAVQDAVHPKPQAKATRRTPKAWRQLEPVLAKWVRPSEVAAVSLKLQDMCATMDNVADDFTRGAIEDMRDAGAKAFDYKAYHAAIEARQEVQATAFIEIRDMTGGRFSEEAFKAVREAPEFGLACPTVGMNHEGEDKR